MINILFSFLLRHAVEWKFAALPIRLASMHHHRPFIVFNDQPINQLPNKFPKVFTLIYIFLDSRPRVVQAELRLPRRVRHIKVTELDVEAVEVAPVVVGPPVDPSPIPGDLLEFLDQAHKMQIDEGLEEALLVVLLDTVLEYLHFW